MIPLVALAVVAHACLASWYGTEHRQHTTANGEHFTGGAMTCALRSTPRNEVYLVAYRGKTIRCRHNDFGPAEWTGRCIDLSKAAAARLGILHRGSARVLVTRARG
jgi:rare lipoprotein A